MYEKVIIIPQSLHFISEHTDERFELPLKQIAILLPPHVFIFSLIFSLPRVERIHTDKSRLLWKFLNGTSAGVLFAHTG